MGAETIDLAKAIEAAPWVAPKIMTKNGVSDADLMRAARDMYEALVGVMNIDPFCPKSNEKAMNAASRAVCKAHGDDRS